MTAWEKKLSKINKKKENGDTEKILEQQKIASANSADVIPVYMKEKSKPWINEDKWMLKDGKKENINRLHKIW